MVSSADFWGENVRGDASQRPHGFDAWLARRYIGRRAIGPEPVAPGAVQVTNDGQCIVLGVDGQNIGGYPKWRTSSTPSDMLGQLRPGEQPVAGTGDTPEAEQNWRRNGVLG